jgi:type IV pilus assembly protein PilO
MTEERKSTWRERLAAPLTWHYVGFAVLLALTIGLAVRVGLDWAAIDTHSSDVLAEKQVQLRALDIKTAPLRGLDKRVETSRMQMSDFMEKRISPNYSSISDRVVSLGVKSGVRLTRLEYSQGAPGTELTEIQMDAGITGQYPQIMKFINSLERDQIFFLIRSMSLTGQQGGMVSLRLQLSTWLRPEDIPPGTPLAPAAGTGSTATQATAAKEGE